jgi:D-alanine-D-alanine ligase
MTLPLADRHIAVLLGGISSEREVSLTSGRACAEALERQGAKVSRIDAGRDLGEALSRLKPDVVFNILHGSWGEDGCVQGVLETLGRALLPTPGVLASGAGDGQRPRPRRECAPPACRSLPGGGLFDRREVASRHVIVPPMWSSPTRRAPPSGVFRVFRRRQPAAPGGRRRGLEHSGEGG